MKTTTTRTAAFALALVVASAALAESSPVVNINTATETQLMYLPGVGAKTASAIVEYSEGVDTGKRHVFTSADELLAVKGIGPKKLAAMRPYVVLTGETTATEKIKVAKPAK